MSNESNPTEGMEDIVKALVERDSKGNLNIANLDETERTKNNICKILSKENMYIKPQNIQLVSETTKAINLIADLYMREGDCIIVEEPIMPDVVSIIKNKGINIVTVPMERDGINIEILERKIYKFKPKFIYTIPNFHNPTGITTTLDKRLKIIDIAHRYGVPIIEEDSQRDFRYSEDRIPSIYSLDRLKSVVYIDSFTMVFPYGIKTGYVVGPSDMVKMLGVLVALDEIFIDNVGHFLLNEYIERGFMRIHSKKLAKHYLKKRNLICEQLDLISDKGIKYLKPDGGVIIWCELDEGIDEKLLCSMAERNGVLIIPGYLFFPDTKKRGGYLRLCFSDVTDEEIIKGIKVIGNCLDNMRKGLS